MGCFAFRAYSCAAWCLMDLGLFGLVVYLCCLLMIGLVFAIARPRGKLTGAGILDTRVSGSDGWAMPLMIWSNSLGLTGKPLNSVGFIFSFPCLE